MCTPGVDAVTPLRGFVADVVGVEGGAMVVKCPESAGELVGQGDGSFVVALALREIERPGV